jgi:TPR repeat protein
LAICFRSIRIGVILCQVAIIAAICFCCSRSFAFAADVSLPKIEAAAENGDIGKQIELARDYFVGRGVPQDAKMAAFWYRKAAESGDASAEDRLAFLYQTGQGVQADPDRAFHWFQLAAASGVPEAKASLGAIYLFGNGVQKDELLAAQLFKEAAAKGSGVAATYLGDMYLHGIGVKEDAVIAEGWYEKGVTLRDPFSEYDMGVLLSTRKNHTHDLPRAVKLLRQSASSGYVPAMHSLGLLLTNHPELADSRDEARPLFEIAAAAGCWKSSVVLGALARDGHGESSDPESAFYHFQVAVLQGGEEAKRLLSTDLHSLEMQLREEQRSSLTSEAEAWYSKHHTVFEFVFQDSNSDSTKWSPASSLAALSHGIHEGIIHPVPPS